jgi:probable HAF family extracellular repeat protein
MNSTRLCVALTLFGSMAAACTDSRGPGRLLPTEASLAKPAPQPSVAVAIDLGLAYGSEARNVNDRGQIVGTSPGLNAFIWENGAARSLGTVSGMTSSRGEDINANGDIVGYYFDASGHHAFVWTASGGIQPLPGTLGGCCTLARQINDHGLIVGEATLPGGSGSHMVVWENGVMRDIQGSQPRSAFPWGLSNSGVAVGQLDVGFEGGFSWSESTGIVHLAGLSGPNDVPMDVNSVGQIVGWAPVAGSSLSTAFLWQNGTRTNLGTLGGRTSVAWAINEAGEVVGRSEVAGKGKTAGGFRAFLWTATSGMRDLGLPDSPRNAQAMGLNSTGWVVGATYSASGSRATLWKRQ